MKKLTLQLTTLTLIALTFMSPAFAQSPSASPASSPSPSASATPTSSATPAPSASPTPTPTAVVGGTLNSSPKPSESPAVLGATGAGESAKWILAGLIGILISITGVKLAKVVQHSEE